MYYRKTYATINCDAIRDNLQAIQQITSKSLIAVLKANAYGHSDYWVAKTAMDQGCCMVAVSSLDEALSLRVQGFQDDILILGYVNPSDIPSTIQKHIIVSVVSYDWTQELIKQNPHLNGLRFHIKVDSGMNRIGLKNTDEINQVIQMIESHHGQVEGIFTHYACADDDKKEMCYTQYNHFNNIVSACNHSFKWIHCENSAAILSFPDTLTNCVRVGLIMYGISPVKTELPLVPALSLTSHLTCVKKVSKGETIGYGATYQASEDCWIGTLPIGYADGFIRANQGRHLYCMGEYIEIVGRICMDQCMVKLPYKMNVDTPVEIISSHLSVEQMANELNTIPYEILCLLSDRIPRIIYSNQQQVAIINHRLHES